MTDGAPAPGPGGGFDVNKVKGQLGTPGLIAVGSAAGVLVACLLPWWSVTTTFGFGGSFNGFNVWHGNVSFLVAAAAAVAAVMVAMGKAGPNEKNLCFGIMGAGAVVVLVTLLFFFSAGGGASSAISAGKSIGCYLNFLAGAGLAFGGFSMAKTKGHLK